MKLRASGRDDVLLRRFIPVEMMRGLVVVRGG